MDELFGDDMEVYFAIKKCSDTVQPNNKSKLLQNMDTLDVVVLVTSNIDCDLEYKVPQESDFRSTSIETKFGMLDADTNTV